MVQEMRAGEVASAGEVANADEAAMAEEMAEEVAERPVV